MFLQGYGQPTGGNTLEICNGLTAQLNYKAFLHESQGFFLYYTAAESDMPSDARHHLLVALLGRTPQVLTETLFALCVDAGIPISEIWAISTEEGMKAALDKRWQDPKSTECPDLSL